MTLTANKWLTMFDVLRWASDYKLDHRHQGGWVNIHCPFCQGSQDYHLGLRADGMGCHCWRCGKHKLWDTVKAVCGSSPGLLSQIRERYGAGPVRLVVDDTTRLYAHSVSWPAGVLESIPVMAVDYLRSRGFDPIILAGTWGLRFTGPTGPYKFRIIAPIYDGGKLVSYQGRCYTGKRELRYKACLKDLEAVDHQNLLYGEWLVTGQHIIVVEGITDAWRFGPGAVATFGIGYTKAQVERLAKYGRVSLVFDSDPQAIEQAELLGAELKGLNPEIVVDIVELEDGDPGELSAGDVRELKRRLGL